MIIRSKLEWEHLGGAELRVIMQPSPGISSLWRATWHNFIIDLYTADQHVV